MAGTIVTVRYGRAAVWGILAALGLALACSLDKGNGPEPVDTWVYIATQTGKVLIFDASADTIVDSVKVEGGIVRVTADPEEPRFATIRHGSFRLYVSGEKDPSIVADIPSSVVAFGSGGILIGSGSADGCASGDRGTRIYQLPEMTVLEPADSVGLRYLRADHSHGRAYGFYYTCDDYKSLSHSDLAAYDYRKREFFKRWKIDADSTGDGSYIVRYAIHPNGIYAYVITSDSRGASLICYNLRDEVIVFKREVQSVFGWPEVKPDGKEVWSPQPGYGAWDPDPPEIISVFDAQTGSPIQTISLEEYRVKGQTPVRPRVMRFVQGGSKAYVICGQDTGGPVLVIDTRTKEVLKAFFTDETRYPSEIDIGPAPAQ